jgi:hypothetical protein
MAANIPQLRPMSAGDILDRAIRIYRQNFVPLVIIVAIISLPYTAIQVAITLLTNPFVSGFAPDPQSVTSDTLNTGMWIVGQLLAFVLALVYSVAVVFQSGALTAFVSEKFLGRPITVRQAYGRAFRRWLSLLIATFLLTVIFVVVFGVLCGVWLVPFLGFAAVGSGLDSSSSAAFSIISLALCCLFVPALGVGTFLVVRWIFFIQAIVLENYNSTGALGRSWKLGKGSFWRVFFLLVALTVLVLVLNFGFYLLAIFVSTLLQSPFLIVVLSSISLQLINIIITPLQFAALTVLYYDLRIRKEGFDLEWQMQNLPEAPSAPTLAPAFEPQPPPASPASAESSLDLPPLYSRDNYVEK